MQVEKKEDSMWFKNNSITVSLLSLMAGNTASKREEMEER